jgi:hypothetical protein
MTNGSVILNGITDRELVIVLEAKLHNEGKINFNPAQLQPVPAGTQTYNNLVVAWNGQPGLEVVMELLREFGSEKPPAHKGSAVR